MEKVIQDMDKYAYEGSQGEIFEKLKNAVEDIDTEACAGIIAEWRKEMR